MPIITHNIKKRPSPRKRHEKGTNRVSTGLEEYDMLLGGGFQPESVNLITGCSGSGKTLFCLSYLFKGAELHGKRGIYITIEEYKERLVENARNIGLDILGYEDKITFFDIPRLRELYSSREEVYNENSLLDVNNLIELIMSHANKVDLLVIDTIVPLSIRYSSLNEFRAALFRLKLALKSLKATCLITTEVPSSSPNCYSRFDFEDFIADSVTLLKFGEFEKDVNNWFSDKHYSERFIRIHKIRGSDHVKAFVEFRITDSGIKISAPYAMFR